MKNTIKELLTKLKSTGKVEVKHYRQYPGSERGEYDRYFRRKGWVFGCKETKPDTCGGLTVVEVNGVSMGTARCSTKDSFSYKRGTLIALGRAVVNSYL